MTDEAGKSAEFEAPRVGSDRMPQWETGELIKPPRFTAVTWFALLGPGLVMGASAIGGGEWLVGPIGDGQVRWRVDVVGHHQHPRPRSL